MPSTKLRFLAILIAAVLLSVGLATLVQAQAGILYVKPGAAGSCSSWAAACELQTALSAAQAGDEIWVATGVYKPTANPSDRDAFFRIRSGVAVYGGFAGTENARQQRDWQQHVTVLSGDIDNNDITDANGVITNTANITGTNSYHVVYAGQRTESFSYDPPADATAVLDGFTITGGLANHEPGDLGWSTSGGAEAQGGGMYNARCRYWVAGIFLAHTCVDVCNPTLRNLTFRGNRADSGGGGMHNFMSDPDVHNVVFDSNVAAAGGGMSNSASSPWLINVTFQDNAATEKGGGMYNWTDSLQGWPPSNPILADVVFSHNSAGENGGGMYNDDLCSPSLLEVIFADNYAADGGGGMFNFHDSPDLTDVTFQGNIAGHFGGGMYNLYEGNPTLSRVGFTANRANVAGGGMYNRDSSPGITNVTFQDNWAPSGGGMYNFGADPVLTNVDVSGNGASSSGGGMENFFHSDPRLTNVTFTGNRAGFGGGMANTSTSSPDLVNVVFDRNAAGTSGGGMLNWSGSDATLANVTFSGNSASFGGGMDNLDSSPTIANCILWGNTARYGASQIDNDGTSTPVVSYSVVQGSGGSGAGWDGTLGTDGGSNLDADPLYADPAGGDLRLSHDSPAVDAGNNAALPAGVLTDVAGKPRFTDIPTALDSGAGTPPIVDMGALEAREYEFLPRLAKSVDHATPRRNEPLVYTIVVENANGEAQLTDGVISDSLPAGLTFAGPIALDPPGAGTVGTVPPILVSDLVLDSGQRVTVTLPVTCSAYVPGLTITNTASIAVAEVAGQAQDSVAIEVHPIIYVDADATGANDGTSWSDAYTDLQDALAVAVLGNEIWVAEGRYTPVAGTDRGASFALKSGVAVYGGFAGTESALQQRDWQAQVTVLSGDIEGDDLTDVHGVVTSTANIVGGNAYHVVTGSGVDGSALLDGFTLTGGQANGSSPDDRGGGMRCAGGSPTLVNVVFRGNVASEGGGMASLSNSRPALTNVVFRDNAADRGGGMFNHSGSAPELVNVALYGNTASDGAAMLNELNAGPTLVNVTFQGNAATNQGGGIVNVQTTILTVTNSILWGNGDAGAGDQVYNDGSSAASISYSDVQGGWPGTGNIDANPLFADAADGDLRLQLASPAIDAGVNQALPSDGLDLDYDGDTIEPIPYDLAGNPRLSDVPTVPDTGAGTPPIVDMGAFEALIYGIVPRMEKTVDRATPWAGDMITFTIVVENPDETDPLTNAVISDTLPSGLTLAGPIALDPPGAGTVGTVPPALVTDLTVGPGQRVTVTFPVLVDADLSFDAVVTNTAVFTSTETPAFVKDSIVISVAGLIYADASATGANDGTSWMDAYTDLQDALAVADEGDQIWVAAGIYRPTGDGADRSATFQLKRGVAVYGGFAGTPGSEGNLGARDWEQYVTVLSGDIDRNDLADLHGVITSTAHIAGTNSYHVVTGGGVAGTTVLDGFRITGGVADGSDPHDRGGGMANSNGTPRLANLVFGGNRALYGGGMSNMNGNPVLENVVFQGNQATTGGGMANWPGSAPALIGVTFDHNRADEGGGGMVNLSSSPTLLDVTFYANSAGKWAGGMYNREGSHPSLQDVVFASNAAASGGGMYNHGSSPALTDVIFQGNSATYGGGLNNHWQSHPALVNVTFTGNSGSWGGGMNNFHSSPVLANVVFYGNSASSQGGGIYSAANSHPSLTNVTLSGNAAGRGGGMYNIVTSTMTIQNSILWGNTATFSGAQIDHDASSPPDVSYSDVQGGWPGTGNIDLDPFFVDAASGDLRLWHTSLAIDAGNNAAVPADIHDLDGDGDTGEIVPYDLVRKPRLTDIATVPDSGAGTPPIVDMGALEAREYEFLPRLVKSVDHATPRRNEPLVYTIVVENIDPDHQLTDGVISDSLPAGLTFAGPIALDPPGAGTVGTAPPILVSDLVLDSGQRVTVTLPVTCSAYVPGLTITNTASIAVAEVPGQARDSVAIEVHPIIYVDADATGANDGTSWSDAYTDLQDALAVAVLGNEIWVAEGRYTPVAGTDRGASFALKSGVAVYGGFAGNESALQQRDWQAQVTVLSGDIEGNDLTDVHGVVTSTANIVGGNAYHVVTGSGVDGSALLDGFTLTGGQANGSSPDDRGGGMRCAGGSPALVNVVFRGNLAVEGGGMANLSNSRPALTNVVFRDNAADRGGGMANLSGTGAALVNLTFSGNAASIHGGGMYNSQSSLTVRNSILWDNTAPSGAQAYSENGTIAFSYSDIQGCGASGSGWDGSLGVDEGGNIDADPRFAGAPGGNLAPGGDLALSGDLRPWSSSPAIDAGENSALPRDVHDLDGDGNTGERIPFDMAGNPRLVHGAVDMGAFESAFLLAKAVDDPAPVAGQWITYTVVVENASTRTQLAGGLISDTLPAGLTLAGPVTLDPPGAGTVASLLPILVDDVTLDPGERITVTFPAVVGADLPATAMITNVTTFTSTGIPVPLVSRVPIDVAGVIYVDRDASGANDGTSWEHAFSDLQDALAHAAQGDEIWVAEGLYMPTAASGDRSASFQLKSGVAVYGGFAGTESALQQRDWQQHVTVLSGDIDGNDWTDAHGVITDTFYIQGGNSYHVVTGGGVDASAVLDGLTITGGQADGGGSQDLGGGMYNYQGSPTLRNVIVRGNAAVFGGGMYNDESSPTLANVALVGNTAYASAGGMYDRQSRPVLINVTLSGNDAPAGSGMVNQESDPTIVNSILWGNGTQHVWDQVYNDQDSTPAISHSDVQGSGGSGPGWYNTLGIDGGGNLDVDPLFADAAGGDLAPSGDLRLWINSPAIDAGDTAMLPPDIHDLDGDGDAGERIPFDLAVKPRIVGRIVDMGAYEHVPLLVKMVNDVTPASGDRITYTVVVENPYAVAQLTGGVVSDALPSGLTFAGPLLLDPPGAGVVGTSPPTLVSDLVVGPGERVTVTLPVTVDLGLPATEIITNTAELSVLEHPEPIEGRAVIEIAGVIYVDDSAAGANNGSSWTDAYTDLQDALAAAYPGDEIWVAQGVYRPTGSTTNRFATFYLKDNVALYGGFAGTPGTEGDFSVRDWETYVTVLSGDIDRNDQTDAHGVITHTANIAGANSYHVVIGSFTQASAVLDGFTVTGGYADGPSILFDDKGGGMHNENGSPSVRNVVFQGNLAADDGGGMYNNLYSDPLLINVTLCNNAALDEGGGLFNDVFCDPVLTNVRLISNTAGGDGGGLFNDWFSQPTLTDVEFRGNSATHNGGGMYNDVDNDTTLTNVTFVLNTAGNDGGAFFNEELSDPVLTNVRFISNTASVDGGGMYNMNESDPALVNVDFTGNVAGDEGGGLFNKMFSDPTLTSVTFISNTASGDDGGGMYNIESSPVLSDVVFERNVAGDAGGGMYNDTYSNAELTSVRFISNTASGDGGGMYNFILSDPLLTDVTFSGNTAGDDGGGMFSEASSDPRLTDVTFSGNFAEGHGGGMCSEGGNAVLTSVTWISNTATSNGGGLYNRNSAPVLADVIFDDNYAGGRGGGLYNVESDLTLESATIVGNVAQDSGGGMYNQDSSATLSGVVFDHNSAVDSEGGGMVNYTFVLTPTQSIVDSVFSGNSAGVRGGGMSNIESSPTLTNVTFDGNEAGDAGGGMYNMFGSHPLLTNVTFRNNLANDFGGGMCNAESNPTMTNVLFSGNTADEGGGMRNHAASDPTLINVTFAGNVAAWEGGAVFNDESSATIQNSILWGNMAGNAGDQIQNNAGTAVISDTIVQGGCPSGATCGRVLDADPMFMRDPDPGDGLWTTPIDNDYGDLHLRLGSPAIDAGENAALPPGVTADLDGNPRIVNGRVDMGAYEAGLLLLKMVDDPTPRPGDLIAFTIVAENAYTATQITGGILSDTLPTGLTFVGPIVLDPPGAGVVGLEPPILVSDLTIPESQRVTVTVPVLVDEGQPNGHLDNTAALTSLEIPGPILSRIRIYVSAGILYVDDSATGAGDGSSWADAYNDLQDALAVAVQGDQIWVAQGVYTPTLESDPGDPRSATFQLRNGVALYGGFPDGGGTFAERDWIANPTVLSGDIDGNDTSDAHGVITDTANIQGNNSYHVVTASGTDASARLDGFVLTGGDADTAWEHHWGGGMYTDEGSPTLVNLLVSGNWSIGGGGGMGNWSGSPTLTNVVFRANATAFSGGGMYNNAGSSPTLVNVTFISNTATENDGGGMANFVRSNPLLVNVTFYANSAGHWGGAMYNVDSPTVQNSILWGNTAPEGSQMYNYAGNPSVTYSLIEGGCPTAATCSNLLTGDPLFIDAAGGDLRLQFGSPAVDAGDNSLLPADSHDVDSDGDTGEPIPVDLSGDPRIVNGRVDMGAYEAEFPLLKTVDDLTPRPGERITYTIVVHSIYADAPMTGGVISDTLPAGLTFAGPIHLDPPGAGLVGTAPPMLVTDLTIAAGGRVTVTFAVTVDADVPPMTAIANTAAFSSAEMPDPIAGSVSISVAEIPPVPPGSVTLTGPTMGAVQVGYAFTATTSPISATLPITYEWQATGQAPVEQSGGLSHTVTFTWETPGTETITVTAWNAGGMVTATHTIHIAAEPVPPSGVTLAGPAAGAVQVGYAFTATTSPISATVPITYEWQATGQAPVEQSGGLSHTATFTWETPGTETITITAWNAGGMVTATHTIHIAAEPVPPSGVTIAGPAAGTVQVGYAFTATTSPISATLPITYLWQATGQAPVEQSGGLSHTATFTWETPGTETITITVTNAGGTVSNTHVVIIAGYKAYLPQIMRDFSIPAGYKAYLPQITRDFSIPLPGFSGRERE